MLVLQPTNYRIRICTCLRTN